MKKLSLLMGLLAGSMAVPLVVLLALAGVTGTALACSPGFLGGPLSDTAPVPAAAQRWVAITRAACPVLPATFIAAVMAQESGFGTVRNSV